MALAEELGGIGLTGSNQSQDDIQGLVDAAVARWGRIDVMVNSAGHGPRKALLDLTDEDWQSGIRYLPPECYPGRTCRHTLPWWQVVAAPSSTSRPRGSGNPRPCFPTSAVARAGLAAFTKLYADEHAARNIRMNNVLPGWIDSLPRLTTVLPLSR